MVGLMCYSMHYLTGISYVGEKRATVKVGESMSIIGTVYLLSVLKIWYFIWLFGF